MTDDNTPIIEVGDKLSTQYGNTLTGTFVIGNKMVLNAYRPILGTSRDEPSENAGKFPVYLHMIQQDFVFCDPLLRSLIAESNSTFVALQGMEHPAHNSEYVKISRTYRSIIRACMEKLEDAVSTAELKNDLSTLENYKEYITIFYSIECVWHLCEILLINAEGMNTIVPKLLSWVRFHFPHSERAATNLMLLGRDASESETYWPTLKALITQGQIEVTRAILQLNPSAQSVAYKIADGILKAIPQFNDGLSIQKFRSQWEYWQAETDRKLASNILSTEPKLEELIHLVTGDSEAWNSLMTTTDVWYEYLPSYLFYTNPACKYFELGDVANAWLNRWTRLKGKKNELKRLDYVLLHLMENNIKSVLHSIQLIPDNQWFATHLIDLLYHSGQLKTLCDSENIEYNKLRDSLLNEFGSCLMTRNSFWQLGIGYIEHCAEYDHTVLEMLLTRIPIRTEHQAFKIIAIARQKGFEGVETEICKVLSKRSFNDGRYGNALEWAVRSKDSLYVSGISDFILKYYTTHGTILCPDVIANIGAKMFISPRLVFLVKYFDFNQFYQKRDFLLAAELLINLLESKITPYYFWPTMLLDTIPLLESRDPKILSRETSAILNHLEKDLIPLIKSKKKKQLQNPEAPLNVLKDYRVENIEEMILLLRLACARNLSRSLIIENTISS